MREVQADRRTRPDHDDKAERASAAMVLQAAAKAERAFVIYLPNNPLHEKFFEDLRLRLAEHLERFGDLALVMTPEGVRCLGEVVYAQDERRENIGFRMFSDGIRVLVVHEGIEPREVRALVEALRGSAADSGEDDIVTRLWSAGLAHVSYELAEVPAADGVPLLGPVSARTPEALASARAAQAEKIRHFASRLVAADRPPPLPLLPQEVLALEQHEVEALQRQVEAEQQRAPIADVVPIVEAVVVAEADPAVLAEVLEVVARLCGDLVLTGRLDAAVTLVEMLSRIAARPDLPPTHAACVAASRRGVMSADVVDGLARLLSDGEFTERDELRALVTMLGTDAIEPFCRILRHVATKENRKVLIDALADVGRGAPELFLPFLADPRWFLVRNTIYILRRIGSPEAVGAVRRCARHADARVRKEVLFFLEEAGGATEEPLLLAFLEDQAPSLRIAAARALARSGSRAGAERLLALVGAAGFAERERSEREAFWEALAESAPERALPLLRELLARTRWFGRARELDDTACAVAGLRRIGSPAARELLEQDRKSVV
jgi:HEAT repeat protein